jgi:hypothetical protein
VAAAVTAGAAVLGTTGPAAAQSSAEAELQRTVTTLRAQLRSERARTTRIVRAKRRRHSRNLAHVRRKALRGPSVSHALALGAAAYGVSPSKLRRVASCESGLRPTATNGRYVGLFQFGSTLWRQTPYGDFDRSDPYAAAMAASYAFARGWRSHWPVCGSR